MRRGELAPLEWADIENGSSRKVPSSSAVSIFRMTCSTRPRACMPPAILVPVSSRPPLVQPI